MRILIYGAGAVGCYIGGHLAAAGHSVTLLGREPLARAARASGLAIRTAQSTLHIRDIRAASSLDEALSGEYDWIAFTMKAYDTAQSALELQARLVKPPPIVSFQNGVGNEESLIAAFGAERVAAGTMTTPVSMPEPGIVVEEKPRGLAVAVDSPAATPVLEALRQTQLPTTTVQTAASLKWSKLLLNIVGNATAAILDMSPADIFADPELFAIEYEALREAIAIIHLQGISVVNLPGSPARLLALAVQYLPASLLRPLLLRQVATGRGAKPPSLLADLRAKKRRTEVPWLNGAIVQAADRMDRLVPVNHVLALTVSDIAAGRVPWEMFRQRPDMLLTAVRAVRGGERYGE